MTFEFPRALLREKTKAWNLAGVSASPGVTATSVSTYVRTDGGGFWTCQMSDVLLSNRRGGTPLVDRNRQKVATLLWRAVRQIANGGVTPMIVPCNDTLFRPWPANIPPGSVVGMPHFDGSLFGDGTGYEQSVIDITCAAASLRDTTLTIAINVAGQFFGGERFSIKHPTMDWRLYEIATVDVSSTAGTITFNPPLREDVAAGTRLEFDRPRCKMRLASPNAMDLAESQWTASSASAAFVEAA